ncbi:MAG: aminotransferase class I/II-fold pyridoxal phosphate-dependent enzyme, partial [Cyclobacteriaceae bacterium]
KTISPGIRVGYIYTNRELLEKIEMRSRASLWMNSPLLNEIVTDLIKTGKAMTLLKGKRETIAERQKVLAKAFKGLTYKTHPNAFHVWLTLPDYWKLKEFKEALLAKNIIVQPSNVFSLSNVDAYDAVRISMGSPKTTEELTTGLQIIADTVREHPR